MQIKAKLIFRKRGRNLIHPRRKKFWGKAARKPNKRRSGIKQHINILGKACLPLERVGYYNRKWHVHKTELNFITTDTIGAIRGQHSSQKAVIMTFQFFEHKRIIIYFSKIITISFQKNGLLSIGYSENGAMNIPQNIGKAICGMTLFYFFLKNEKCLDFEEVISSFEPQFLRTSTTLQKTGNSRRQNLNSYAAEMENPSPGRYIGGRHFLEMQIDALPRFQNSLISQYAFVELLKKINSVQSLSSVLHRSERDKLNWMFTGIDSAGISMNTFSSKRNKLAFRKFSLVFFFTWRRVQSFNSRYIDKYDKRTKWEKRCLKKDSANSTSFIVPRQDREYGNSLQNRVQSKRMVCFASKGSDFDKTAIDHSVDIYAKGKDTIFNFHWKPYIHTNQFFVYTLQTQTANVTAVDLSATESRQNGERGNANDLPRNVTEESNPKPEANGPDLESTSARLSLPSQISEGKKEQEYISLSRGLTRSTEEVYTAGATAGESSIYQSANVVEGDQTDVSVISYPRRPPDRSTYDERGTGATAGENLANFLGDQFGFSLRFNPTSASKDIRQPISPTDDILPTTSGELLTLENEHFLNSTNDHRHQRTGRSAGSLQTVDSGIDGSLGGTFSTSHSTTRDSLYTLRVAGGKTEMQTFTPMDIEVNPPQRQVINSRSATPNLDEQTRGILDSVILQREGGNIYDMQQLEQVDICLSPSDNEEET